MNVYYIVAGPLILFSFLSLGLKHKNNLGVGFFVFLSLVILNYVRGPVGSDYLPYDAIISGVGRMGPDSYAYLESGFRHVTYFLKCIFDDNVHVFGVYGTFILLCIYIGISRLKINVVISLVLYFLLFYINYLFNGLRQGIAMGLFILALRDILYDNKKGVFAIGLAAYSFHFSGIFVIVSYFFSKLDIKVVFYILIGSLLMSVVGLSSILFQIFSAAGMVSKVEMYQKLSEPTSFVQYIMRLILLAMVVYCYLESRSVTMMEPLVKVYLLGTILFFLFVDQNVFATRINMFFRVSEIAVFSSYVSLSKTPPINKIIMLVAVLCIYTSQFNVMINLEDNLFKFNHLFGGKL